jgi:hypothetical protein
METLTLTAPVQVSVGATAFRVWDLEVRRNHPDRPAGILVIFREVNGGGIFISGGRSIECHYEGAEAEALILVLNKSNLSTTSLEKCVTQKCQLDGKLGAGVITGTVD